MKSIRLNPGSLRFQLCLWHILLVVVTVVGLGVFSLSYLTRALASSREATLRRRVDRIVRFADTFSREGGTEPMSTVFEQFRLVSPDSDLFIVQDVQHQTIFPANDHHVIRWPSGSCWQACVSIQHLDGKRMRLVQQRAVVKGKTLLVSLAGQVDEHSDVTQVVRNSYLIAFPFLLAFSLLNGLLLAHRALGPVDRITRSAREINIGDLKQRLFVPHTGDEIERLAIAWNELLERLDKAVDRLKQFTSDISHDLKTSLTVMSATAQVSIRKQRSTDEYTDALKTILLECESTRQLLDDLLATSRSGVEERRTHQLLPISEVLEESCDQIHGRMEMKRLELQLDIEEGKWIIGDLSLVRRLAMILLDNAIKFTPEGGHVRVSLKSLGTQILLQVEDTGIGIAEGHVDKIFDRSYRVDSSRNRNHGGNGLGLAIAKWIAETHLAELSASSTPGAGSRFCVAFQAQVPA